MFEVDFGIDSPFSSGRSATHRRSRDAEFGLLQKLSGFHHERRKAPAQADVFCGLSPKKTWHRN